MNVTCPNHHKGGIIGSKSHVICHILFDLFKKKSYSSHAMSHKHRDLLWKARDSCKSCDLSIVITWSFISVHLTCRGRTCVQGSVKWEMVCTETQIQIRCTMRPRPRYGVQRDTGLEVVCTARSKPRGGVNWNQDPEMVYRETQTQRRCTARLRTRDGIRDPDPEIK